MRKEKEIIKLTKESLDIQNALSLERNKATNKSSGLSVNNINTFPFLFMCSYNYSISSFYIYEHAPAITIISS